MSLDLETELSLLGQEEGYKDEDRLREEYVVEGKTAREIAEDFGVTAQTICNWLHRHSIPVRGNGDREKPWRDEEVLYQQYVEEDRTSREIADELDVTAPTVRNWLHHHGIPVGDRGDSA